jgi:hypothetical protein
VGPLERSESSRERVGREAVLLRAQSFARSKGLGHEMLVHGYEEIRLRWHGSLRLLGASGSARAAALSGHSCPDNSVSKGLRLRAGLRPGSPCPSFFFILSPLWPPARLRRALSRRWRFGLRRLTCLSAHGLESPARPSPSGPRVRLGLGAWPALLAQYCPNNIVSSGLRVRPLLAQLMGLRQVIAQPRKCRAGSGITNGPGAT